MYLEKSQEKKLDYASKEGMPASIHSMQEPRGNTCLC